MMRFQAYVDPTSDRAVRAALEGIKQGVRNKVVKGGVGKVARIAAKQVKASIPKGPTGAYKAAVGVKYKSYRGAAVWVYIIGARKGMARPNPRPFAKGYSPAAFDPVKYGHLVEGGRKSVGPVRARMLRFYPQPKGLNLVFTRRPVAPVAGGHQIRKQRDWLQSQGGAIAVAETLRLFDRECARYAAKGKSVFA